MRKQSAVQVQTLRCKLPQVLGEKIGGAMRQKAKAAEAANKTRHKDNGKIIDIMASNPIIFRHWFGAQFGYIPTCLTPEPLGRALRDSYNTLNNINSYGKS